MGELTFRDVTVRFGTGRAAVYAVRKVNLTVPAGAVVGLVGGSGSGKSTLAKAATGLVTPSSGTVTLGDTDVSRLRGRHPVQMVFQDPNGSLDPRLTIGDSVAEALPRGLSRAGRRKRVEQLLQMVQLDPQRTGQLPAAMSGGQRQRVAIARALAADPTVIVADEITSALDVSVQGTILNLVRELQRRTGVSVLFISHNLAVVRYVSNFVVVMKAGEVVEQGPVDRVLAAPAHPYTQALLAAVPTLERPSPSAGAPGDDDHGGMRPVLPGGGAP